MSTFTPLQLMIEQAADDQGVDFRAKYSGRGMGNRVCLGLTGSMREIQSVIASAHEQITGELFTNVINARTEEERAAAIKAAILADKLHRQLGQAYHDSMANEIVVYWPQIEPLPGQEDIEGGSDRDDDF